MSDQRQDEAAGPSRVPDRRVLGVAGLVAGLLLLGGTLLLGGGEEEADEVAFAVPRRAVALQPAATPTPSPTRSLAPRRKEPENPFLVSLPESGGDAAADAPAAAEPPAVVVVEQPTAPAPSGAPTYDRPVPTYDRPVPTVPTVPAPTSPVRRPAPPSSATPSSGPPSSGPPSTAPPRPAPAPTTASPTPSPAAHTLVLQRVTGTPTGLRGHFRIDGKAVAVDPGGTAFGPDGVLQLLGLEETGSGWVAVLQVRTGRPFNHPLGTVLRFS